MQNNECIYISEQFTKYQDNSLSSEIRARIDAHLTVCSPCHQLYQDLNKMLDQLHKLPPVSSNQDFTSNLLHHIKAINQEPFWYKIYASSYTRIAGSAIAAGLIVALGMNIWIDPISPRSPQGQRNFSGEQKAQTHPTEAITSQLDSLQGSGADTLELNNSTINSKGSSLQLVSGTK
ncbi:MAG: zf-HC2 domain-containing protein [Candidatus Marinimicrobia bacterium]|nr:zf-HC2 domain-containing protein [Candidatus Neomarinimicrobiota bacterium]